MTEEYANWSASARAADAEPAALRERLREGDRRARRDAVMAFVDRADDDGLSPGSVAALAETAREDPASDVRQFAVEALGLAGADPAHVREPLADDADEWVRAEAVVALSRTAPGDTDRLRAALDDESGWVRRNAVIALGKTGGADPAALRDRLKNDTHPPVREYAAAMLPDSDEDTERAVRLLAAVLARDPDAFVRAKAATGLGDLGTDRAETAIEEQGLHDRSDDVQRAARRALASARGVEPEQLDVDIEEPAAPGGGPGSRSEGGPDAGPTRGSGGPARGAGPGSGPADRPPRR
jgi:HEAT repeat protein